MRITRALCFVLAELLLSSMGVAQVRSPLLAVNGVNFDVPPQTAQTMADIVLDPTAGGGDVLDIAVENWTIRVSLIQPDGTELTSSNAPGLGFQWRIGSPQESDKTRV